MSTLVEFFRKYALRYYIWYLAGIVALLATNFVMTLIPRKVEQAIDYIAIGATATSDVSNTVLTILILAAILIVTRTISRVLIFYPGRFVEFDIRNDIFKKLLELSYGFYQKQRTGDLMSRAANDIQNLRLMVGFALLSLTNTTIIYGFAFFQMLEISPWLTFCTLVPAPFVFAYIIYIVRYYHSSVKKSQEYLGRLTDCAVETLGNIFVIKSFRAEPQLQKTFESENENYKDITLRVAFYRSMMFPFLAVIGSIGNFVLFIFGGQMIMAGQLTVGQFTAFSAYIALLAWPTASLAYMLSVFQRGIISWNRVQEILNAVPDIRDSGATDTSLQIKEAPKLEVRNLNFSFPVGDKQEQAVLSDISFKLNPGGVLGIFGETGSGKSVLASLLARLYDAPAGSILINDKPIEAFPLQAYREALSYVAQDSFLFSETIRSNITYYQRHSNGKDPELYLKEAAKLACVEDEIQSFPNGYDTVVGEKGVILSGGQKNRISLARSLYKDFTLLILDDVLSAVDHSTETKLISNLSKFFGDKTVVLISHRVSALVSCDNIIVLENGKIINSGSHDELIQLEGIYKDTWLYQKSADMLDDNAEEDKK